MKISFLSPLEEITILLIRIEQERHKVLFVKGLPYHDKAVKKIKKMQNRIIKLGGNVDAKLKIE
ncbi:hypothetical protein D3C71_1422810 [compost metagenome]